MAYGLKASSCDPLMVTLLLPDITGRTDLADVFAIECLDQLYSGRAPEMHWLVVSTHQKNHRELFFEWMKVAQVYAKVSLPLPHTPFLCWKAPRK